MAKKMSALFKVYRKFCQKNLGKDPLAAVEKDARKDDEEQIADSEQAEEPVVLAETKLHGEADIPLVSDALTCVTALEDQ